MVNLNNYIIEKFKISKNISADSSSLAEQLYCRLLPNNYEQKDKVIEFLNDWIDDESAKKKVKELKVGENYSWSELDKDGDLWWFYVARLDDYSEEQDS